MKGAASVDTTGKDFIDQGVLGMISNRGNLRGDRCC
jgi:hypothetical protein